ncbi:O-methyltransferase [Adhaeribacter radiodurans]|uniref:Class I SAM-dependent methyltransferase n=1 Tax=Adhaeribacter radiodurans TaxID=2745197 RepID=A0A7L7LCT7_9BACT|nr:class I SAM-dependent methyltransferase [Adhaeribacter radiodurans]QMU30189.1 class I SAM-dependent methyltransferase [Adhaeribacter radiodurans]
MLTFEEAITLPPQYAEIKQQSEALQFNMFSDLRTGSLLRTLAAAKPQGNFLEIGTGTGLSLAWLAAGADLKSTILSIDNEATYQQVAINAFANDKRITFSCTDGNEWLKTYDGPLFDLIFADAWPGKFYALDETLALVKVGGFYIIDDLLPQPNWPAGHPEKVDILLTTLRQKQNFVFTTLDWSTGLMIFTKWKN